MVLRALDDVALLLSQEEHAAQSKLKLQRCPLCWRIISSEYNGKKRRFCSWHVPGSNGYKQATRVLNTSDRDGSGYSAVQKLNASYRAALDCTPIAKLVASYRGSLDRAYNGTGGYSFVPRLYGRNSLLKLAFIKLNLPGVFPETFKFATQNGFNGNNFARILNYEPDAATSSNEPQSLMADQCNILEELFNVFENNMYIFWPEISFAESFLAVQNMRKSGRPRFQNSA